MSDTEDDICRTAETYTQKEESLPVVSSPSHLQSLKSVAIKAFTAEPRVVLSTIALLILTMGVLQSMGVLRPMEIRQIIKMIMGVAAQLLLPKVSTGDEL